MIRQRKSDAERFWPKVIKRESGCWEWIGAKRASGYGAFYAHIDGTNRVLVAHRWSYEHLVGPIPEGLQIDHLCRNRACVNPAHLEPVTQLENARRADKTNIGIHHRVKTHCPQGHPYSGTNVHRHPVLGWRSCRTCKRDYQRRRKAA